MVRKDYSIICITVVETLGGRRFPTYFHQLFIYVSFKSDNAVALRVTDCYYMTTF